MDPTLTVVGALSKLIPAVWEKLQKELELASSAKKEFDVLKDLIEEIGDFLEKAYSKEVIDMQLKADIKKMRKFLYASEDAIDDLLRRESNCKWEGLASYFRHHYIVRTFAVESKDIKTELEKYKDNRERIATVATRHGLTSNHAQSSSAGHGSSSIAFSENTDALVGIKEPMKQLVEWLTKDLSKSKVIFVHGAQGVGKTSLVGAVLRNENVKSHFKYCVWIEDLRSCELHEDREEALMKANAKMWDMTKRNNQGEQMELEMAFRRMRNNNYRWALILDDVGSKHVFESDSLRSHLDQTRPSLLVTTRISSLESFFKAFLDSLGTQPGCAPLEPPRRLHSFFKAFLDSLGTQPGCAPLEPPRRLHSFHILNRLIAFFTGSAPPERPNQLYDFCSYKHVLLSLDDSFTLFCRKMFTDGCCPTELREASNSILKKSEGLPLAILAMCKLLRDNQGSFTGAPAIVQWTDLNGRLGEELLSVDGPIGGMITLRMDHLLDVRACLFYLSIFPLDSAIRCSTMMRLWMAERLIEQGPIKKKAEKTLKKLLDYNIIREKKITSYGKVNTCHVHNLLHQIIIFKSKDEEHAMIVVDPEETFPADVWHLSFHCDMKGDYEEVRVEQLRSLLVFKKVYPESMKKLLGQAKRLKVLDLQRHLTKEEENNFSPSLNSFPEEILRAKYLRYLSLRDTNVRRIDGIGGLVYLETLDLKGSNVSKLPNDILELKKLCHLLAYKSNRSPAASGNPKLGVKAPSAIGVLTSLQKLCMIELNRVKRSKLGGKQWNRKQLLEELGKLANLRRVGISMLRSEDVGLLCSSIEKLTKLVALHLIVAEKETLDLSNRDRRKTPEFLQRVHLTGRLGTWPDWILSTTILVKLVLKRSQLNRDQFQRLGELLSLKHLELQQAFTEVSEMMFEAGRFQQLCFLGLDTFDNLTSINVEEGALPALERLFLGHCKSLTTVPQVITSPKQLKCLELYDMPKEFTIAVKTNEVCKHMKVETKTWVAGTTADVLKPLTDRPRKTWVDRTTADVLKHLTDRQRKDWRPFGCKK